MSDHMTPAGLALLTGLCTAKTVHGLLMDAAKDLERHGLGEDSMAFRLVADQAMRLVEDSHKALAPAVGPKEET